MGIRVLAPTFSYLGISCLTPVQFGTCIVELLASCTMDRLITKHGCKLADFSIRIRRKSSYSIYATSAS